MVQFTTAVFDDGDGPMWAILPDDNTDGFRIGEWDEVRNAHEALTRLLETGQADEQIGRWDERLRVPWLSVSEASQKWDVPTDTIRYACRQGFIPHAEKQGKLWRFPQRHFLHWLNQVYKPRS